MRDLISALEYSFEDITSSTWKRVSRADRREESLYMMIPTSQEKLEIPAFTLNKFGSDVRLYQDIDVLVVSLQCIGKKTNYKSLDAAMREALANKYEETYLIRLPEVKDTLRKYYATQGTIFDESFKPIMMQTWEAIKTTNKEGVKCYDFLRPILRVSPEVFINKSNSIERYIINKIVPTVLSLNLMSSPAPHGYDMFKGNNINQRYKAKVIIDKIPFEIKATDVPSISTTNEELLNIALDNIDEMIQ